MHSLCCWCRCHLCLYFFLSTNSFSLVHEYSYVRSQYFQGKMEVNIREFTVKLNNNCLQSTSYTWGTVLDLYQHYLSHWSLFLWPGWKKLPTEFVLRPRCYNSTCWNEISVYSLVLLTCTFIAMWLFFFPQQICVLRENQSDIQLNYNSQSG